MTRMTVRAPAFSSLALGVLGLGLAWAQGARGDLAVTDTSWSAPTCCPVVELRQYTLHPGQRNVLIELFDRAFVETQEAEGMRVLGQFRDLDEPDRFVWLRGFRDMAERARALGAFYGGPVWKAHRQAANATMVDSDDVLLLRPVRPGLGFSIEGLERPGPASTDVTKRLVIGTVCSFGAAPGQDFFDFFEHELAPLFKAAGATIVGQFVTEDSPNTFPALPVREGEQVFVFFSTFADAAAYERYLAELGRLAKWDGGKALSRRLVRPPVTLRLSPTARSLLGRH